MIERGWIEYLLNALWQVPLLAMSAWALLRAIRPKPLTQYRVWLVVLGLALLLPLRGIDRSAAEGTQVRVAVPAASVDAQGSPAGDFEPGGLIFGGFTGHSAGLSLPFHVRRIPLAASVVHWILGLYFAVLGFGLFRIGRAWLTARRLVRGSKEVTLLEKESAVLAECSERFCVVPPMVRESDALSGPVVVGVVAPVMLWPEGFAEHSEDEIRAALSHELAHIRRRDYLMNLLCEAVALPMAWHPAMYGVQRRIRSTREMVCDAMAAETMESETAYARCLVRLAQSMTGGGLAEQARVPGLFSNHVLEERVMRLMGEERAMSGRAKLVRGMTGAAAVVASVALAATFHVVPMMAQTAVAPAAPVAPVVAVAPAPATPVPAVDSGAKTKVVCHRHKVMVDGKECHLTAEERQRMEKQLAEAQQRVAEATAKLNSPEFRQQMEQAQKQAQDAVRKLNNGELQARMAAAQKQVDTTMARLNTPEFRQQMAEAAARIDEAKLQEQMALAQKQVAAATAKLNSPEFRQQMEQAQKQAQDAVQKLNNGELQRQMAAAQKQIDESLAKVRAQQDSMH